MDLGTKFKTIKYLLELFFIFFIILIIIAGFALYFKFKKNNLIKPQSVATPVGDADLRPLPEINKQKQDSDQETTLLVTGDVLLGRTINYKAIKNNDFFWPWENVTDKLQAADLVLINLENPLINNCPIKTDGMIFCGDLKHAEILPQVGVDIVSLANNHMLNYGSEGLKSTRDILLKNNLNIIGLPDQKLIINKNNLPAGEAGINFGFLAYNDFPGDGIAKAEAELIQNNIKNLKLQADIIIIFFHWGDEYQAQANKRQQELAHLSIDAGADLVLGNHPHWVQNTEIYKNKLIVYSHGNFIFDQMWSQKTREGVIGEYTFANKKLKSYNLIPIKIFDYGQPKIIDTQKVKQLN